MVIPPPPPPPPPAAAVAICATYYDNLLYQSTLTGPQRREYLYLLLNHKLWSSFPDAVYICEIVSFLKNHIPDVIHLYP